MRVIEWHHQTDPPLQSAKQLAEEARQAAELAEAIGSPRPNTYFDKSAIPSFIRAWAMTSSVSLST